MPMYSHFPSSIPISSIVLVLVGVIASAAEEPNAAGEARFVRRARQLIYEGKRSGEGYFSADGKALVFQSEREPGNPFYQIYVLDLETGDCQRVSPGKGKTTCAFLRPGSDDVLFASTHHDPELDAKARAEIEFRESGKERRYSWDYDDRMDIFTSRRDGSGLRRLTDAPGYDAEGGYSPDGSKIVFCSLRGAYPAEALSSEDQKRLEMDPAYFGELYIMSADGSSQRRLTTWPGYDGGPFFTPDGDRIVWRHFEENGMNADVYTMNLEGEDVRRLTDFGCMSWAPFFHPSGEYVAFASNKLGFANFELFLVDALGEREPVRVTHTDGFDGLPVFSPDGNRLSWTSTRTSGGSAQLFLAEWDHAAARAALAAAPSRVATTTQPTETTIEERLRARVEYLASDALQGRMTGTPGARKAAEFIGERLRESGVRPLLAAGSWFQEFEFPSGVNVAAEGNELAVLREGEPDATFEIDRDFRPLAFTANDTVEGDVVFAGYGLVVPGGGENAYDSYDGLDISGKVVLVLRYAPEDVKPERRLELNRYAGLRYKVMLARERGAKAVLFATGPTSPGAGDLASLNFETGVAGSGIVAASVSGKLAELLLSAAGKDLEEIQRGLDQENPHVEGNLPLEGVRVRLSTSVEHVEGHDRNVLGYLPAGGDSKEYVVVGAHYDHIGLGETGTSLRETREAEVHNGADDNASGTAVVLEVASALAKARAEQPDLFRRGVIFALWTGEEIGLVGSRHFAEDPPVPLSSIAAYVNFDMVGRLRDNRLIVQGAGSSSAWRRLVEKRNVAAGFDVTIQDDPYLPTDVTSFYSKEVPVLNFFTGGHEDYHRPSDDPDTLDYDGMARIARFASGIALDIVRADERPLYLKVERTSPGGGRERLRVFLGTIPDYTGAVTTGVQLTGVRAGGPAEKGGLRQGDVIVEFGGQKIANIYDYTYALDAAKVGEPTTVVVLRGGERVTLTVTPEAR